MSDDPGLPCCNGVGCSDCEPDGINSMECGQCDGTGTTQSGSNLEDEECPVCDGTGELN